MSKIKGQLVVTNSGGGQDRYEAFTTFKEAVDAVHNHFLSYDFEIKNGKPYDSGNDMNNLEKYPEDDGHTIFGDEDEWTIIEHKGEQKVIRFIHCEGDGPVGSYRKNG